MGKGFRTWKILSLGLFLIFVVQGLSRPGMFVDGLTYASLSRNMAEGLGHFWDPFYTQSLHPHFYEHPPLAIGMQSLLFKAFGDYWWIQNLYSLLCTLTCLFLIQRFRIKLKYRDRLPISTTLWIATPLVLFCTLNNLLENTLVVCTLGASYVLFFPNPKYRIFSLISGAILISSAFLVKGFVGLFPLAIPLIIGILYPDQRKSSVLDLVLIITIMGLLSLVLTGVYPQSVDSISRYFNQQLIPALKGDRENTTSWRLWIWFQLALELALPLAVILWVKIKNRLPKFTKREWTLLIVGLSASLPLALTTKQRAFYLLPSLPFFFLLFEGLIGPYLLEVGQNFNPKFRKLGTYFSWTLVLIGVLVILGMAGKPKRDENLMNDVKSITLDHPKESSLNVAKSLKTDWKTQAYFMRYGKISLDTKSKSSHILYPKEHIAPKDYTLKKHYTTYSIYIQNKP